MRSTITKRIGEAAWIAAAAMASPAVAQVATPVPTPTPTPAAALPVPAAPVIVLPAATPSPVAAAPVPTPRATAVPMPRAAAIPAPRASASPSPTPVSSPTPTPSDVTLPTAPPPAPPQVTAVPTPVPAPIPAPPPAEAIGYWAAALVAGLAVALGLGWLLLRRRSAREADLPDALREDMAAAPPTLERARLAMALRPVRAGLNLLTATSENEIVVTNIGDAPATDIRVAVALISAHAGQDAELAALNDAPIGRSAVPPFALQPGEQRVVTTVAALLRDAIKPVTAAGRPMFVPIVSVNLRYVAADADAQLAQAFAVGIERVDSAKLAPFWLDALPRMFDQVAARVHGAPLER